MMTRVLVVLTVLGLAGCGVPGVSEYQRCLQCGVSVEAGDTAWN